MVPAGTRLGRYEILRHLAKGGMADLLLAKASGMGGFARHVVIKRIRDEEAHDRAFVDMFLTEARLSAALHHQNIIQVHDIGEEQGRPYFAMEYLHGEDLRSLLKTLRDRGEQPPLQHVLAIGIGVASALHYAHEQIGTDRKPLNIVHRDVSPGNVMVGYEGSIKVADFGIAKAAHRSVVTQAGTLKGKVPYMAPEQCLGAAVDRRSDVYSLGIVLYELLTVRRLYKGGNDYQTMRAIVYGEVPRPSRERPDLPIALEAIVLKALARKVEDRYQSADEVRVALEEFAASAGYMPSLSGLAAYMKELFGRREEPWLVAAEVPDDGSIDIDFDGSGDGLAAPPPVPPDDEPDSPDSVVDIDSLLEHARVRTSPALAQKLPPPLPAAAVAVRKSQPVMVAPPPPAARAPVAEPRLEARIEARVAPPPSAKASTWLLVLGALVLLALGAAIVVLASGQR